MIKNKLRSERGASLLVALLLFLVCVVVGSVVLTAATAAAGRLAGIAESDRRYFTVNSAAELLQKTLDGQSITVERERERQVMKITKYTQGGMQVGDGVLYWYDGTDYDPGKDLSDEASWADYKTSTVTVDQLGEKTNLNLGAVSQGDNLLLQLAAFLVCQYYPGATVNPEATWTIVPEESGDTSWELFMTLTSDDGLDVSDLSVDITAQYSDSKLILTVQNHEGDIKYKQRVVFSVSGLKQPDPTFGEGDHDVSHQDVTETVTVSGTEYAISSWNTEVFTQTETRSNTVTLTWDYTGRTS